MNFWPELEGFKLKLEVLVSERDQTSIFFVNVSNP